MIIELGLASEATKGTVDAGNPESTVNPIGIRVPCPNFSEFGLSPLTCAEG